jgi:hypothetical protein
LTKRRADCSITMVSLVVYFMLTRKEKSYNHVNLMMTIKVIIFLKINRMHT